MLTSVLIYLLSFLLVACMVVLVLKYSKLDQIKMLNLTTFAIFFPVILPFGGRDAMTTGGILILILYGSYIISTVKKGGNVLKAYDWLVYLLIVFGAVANMLAISNGYVADEDLGPVARQYFSFVTSLLLFLVVKNSVIESQYYGNYTNVQIMDRLFSIILVLTAVHVVISVLNRYIPASSALVSVFYSSKDTDALFADGQNRITSFVFTYESYGEILAALCPLAVYKLVTTRKPFWFLCLGIFSCGVLLSVTRSGIMLFALALVLSILYQFRKQLGMAVAFMIFLVISVFTIITVDPQLFAELTHRFGTAEDTYTSGGSILDTINRGNFPDIWQEVVSGLSWYGHSMLRVDFHNLFLTTLHQMGIVGSILFFAILCGPLFLLIRSFLGSGEDKGLEFACLLFMILFLINEMKVEFTRSASYSQICWELVALCYLVPKLREEKQHGKYETA